MGNKMKSVIITFAGMVFTLYGLALFAVSNLNLGVMLVIAFGIAAIFIGLFCSKIKKLMGIRLFGIFKTVLIVLLCAEGVLTAFIAAYGFSDNSDYKEQAVIVLGAGVRGDRVSMPLRMRLDKAVDYHSKNPQALIVVTGGRGLQETVTEASAMEKHLVQNGVDKSIILKEEKATSTRENLFFSKEILDEQFKDDYSVVVITNNFHVFRSTVMAKKTGFKDVTHIHAGLQWYNLAPCFIRESLAVLKMFVFG